MSGYEQDEGAASSSAGPSTLPLSRKQKKRAARENGESTSQPALKTARLASSDVDDTDMDPGDGAGVDPMEQLANGAGDPMEHLENGGTDPMQNLEQEMGEDSVGALPTRADEFEQQAEREVDVSKGLDGAATGDEGKMKLVHQVRHQVSKLATFVCLYRLLLGRLTSRLPVPSHRPAQTS